MDEISEQGKFLMRLLAMNQNARAGQDVMEHQPLAAMRETKDFLLAHQKMTKRERLETYKSMAMRIWPNPTNEEIPEGFPTFSEVMLTRMKGEHGMEEDDIVDEDGSVPEEPKCTCIEEYNDEGNGTWPKWLEIQHITEEKLYLHCPVCNIDRVYQRS